MNKMIALAAVLGSALLFTPAEAAPIGNVSGAGDAAGAPIQKVDYRGYQHCHWRYGRRWCHGDRSYRRGPGINLYIGPRHRGWSNRHGGHGYRGGHGRFAR